MRPSTRRCLFTLSTLLGVAGCPTSPDSHRSDAPSIGSMEISIGNQTQKIPYASVECSRSPQGLSIELSATRRVRTRAGTRRTPSVLQIHVPTEGPPQATAYAFGTQWAGVDYEVLTLVARDVPGVPHDASCSVKHDDERQTLQCSGATPLPWYAPGGPPPAEFEAHFACPA